MRKKNWEVYVGQVHNNNVLILDTFQKETKRRGIRMFHCKCLLCGNEFDCSAHDVLRNDSRKIQSCGCVLKKKTQELGKKTGKQNIIYALQAGHQKYKNKTTDSNGNFVNIYINYRCMMQRCYNEKDICYKNYGKKGIKVCDDWLNYDNYHDWAVSNGYKNGCVAHRIDNDKDYCPDNVMFIDRHEHDLLTQYLRKHNISELTKEETSNIIKKITG